MDHSSFDWFVNYDDVEGFNHNDLWVINSQLSCLAGSMAPKLKQVDWIDGVGVTRESVRKEAPADQESLIDGARLSSLKQRLASLKTTAWRV